MNTSKSKIIIFTKKINKINLKNAMYYGTLSLEWVAECKYLGIIIKKYNTLGRALENLCPQSKRAQAVLDLLIHRHPTLSVQQIMRLFDILIRPILTFDCEIWRVGNYDVIEKVYLNFVKRLLGVKPNTDTAMMYAELGSFPLSIYIRKTVIKCCLKIINSEQPSLPGIVYYNMFNNSVQLWTPKIKQILFETYGRCRMYKEIKQTYKMESYLKCNRRPSLRIYFARFILSSHKFLIERGCWMKPKIDLPNRICTLCNDKDIQYEYHMVLKCVHFHTLRIKFINK